MAASSSTQLVSTSTLVTLLFIQFQKGSYSVTFTIVNECSYPVWPAILSGAGTSLPTTGFSLQPGESNAIPVPASWSGRLWGRTLCSQDSTGKFSCITGDYATAQVVATLAKLTLNGTEVPSFFEVSLVNGFNLPMTVEPRGGNCSATGCGCTVDLNGACPAELKVMSGGEVVACKSACQAFGDPLYCCVGAYGTPETCKPSVYSGFFKSACPLANVDGTANKFTCACVSADYLIIFCPTPPSPSSVKPGNYEKLYPSPTAQVENHGGGHVHGSAKSKHVMAVALVVGSVVCGGLFCNLTIYYYRKNCGCGFHVWAGTRFPAGVNHPIHVGPSVNAAEDGPSAAVEVPAAQEDCCPTRWIID